MLWPDGRVKSDDPVSWARLAKLLDAGIQAVHEVPALLLRLRFSPVDRVAIQTDLVKSDRIGHHKIGGDRRTPKTIRADDH